jgi:hypothetical protein
VILAGLVTATLVNTLVLPAACLRFGQDRGQDRGPEQDQDPAGAPSAPQPREEPAGQAESPVG